MYISRIITPNIWLYGQGRSHKWTLLLCFNPAKMLSSTLAKGRNHLMTAAEISLRETFAINPVKKKNKIKNYSYETVGSVKKPV